MTALTQMRSEDIVNISLSCNHSCFAYCYSFSLFKTDGKWLFSAKCSDPETHELTEIDNCPVENEKAQNLLALIEQSGLIDRLKNFCMPAENYMVCDMTTYSTGLRFEDGTSVFARTGSDKLEQFFFALAKEYV